MEKMITLTLNEYEKLVEDKTEIEKERTELKNLESELKKKNTCLINYRNHIYASFGGYSVESSYIVTTKAKALNELEAYYKKLLKEKNTYIKELEDFYNKPWYKRIIR